MPFLGFSQQSEIGLGVGGSINSKPFGNLIYKGGVITPNYAVNFNYLKSTRSDWQYGVDIHVLELSRRAEKDFPAYYSNADGGGKGKLFVYGEETYSLCFALNKKYNGKSGYFYFGGLLGVTGTLNFQSQDINTHPSPNEIYYKAPSGAYGAAGGLHMGYTAYISKRLAFNAELAGIVYYEHFTNNAPPDYKTNLHYTIVSYPVTVGLRYRIGKPSNGNNRYGDSSLVSNYERILIQQQVMMNRLLVRDSILLSMLVKSNSNVSYYTPEDKKTETKETVNYNITNQYITPPPPANRPNNSKDKHKGPLGRFWFSIKKNIINKIP